MKTTIAGISLALVVTTGCAGVPAKTSPRTTSAPVVVQQPAPGPTERVVPVATPAPQAQPAPPAQVPMAVAYSVLPFDPGPNATAVSLEVGKKVTVSPGVSATLDIPERNGDTITKYSVKLERFAESATVIAEASDVYVEGIALNHLVILRSKPENRDQLVITMRPGAPTPLTDDEAITLAKNEVAQRNLATGVNANARRSGGVMLVTFANEKGDGTAVTVGRYTRGVREIRPLVGTKR